MRDQAGKWHHRQQGGEKDAPLGNNLPDAFGRGCLFTAPTIFPPPTNCQLPSDGKINHDYMHHLYWLL